MYVVNIEIAELRGNCWIKALYSQNITSIQKNADKSTFMVVAEETAHGEETMEII